MSHVERLRCKMNRGEGLLNEQVVPGRVLAPAVPGQTGEELAGYAQVAGVLFTC